MSGLLKPALADRITEQQLEMIVAMVGEWRRLGYEEEYARQLAVRIGMKMILAREPMILELV